jgi:hypothetical protein
MCYKLLGLFNNLIVANLDMVPGSGNPDKDLLYIICRVAAIFPEQFQSFVIALKIIFFIDSFAPNCLSCLLNHKLKLKDTYRQRLKVLSNGTEGGR